MDKIDGLKFKEMLAGGVKALELNRATVDELNVFPVPDGDTGTNMFMTVSSALREVSASGSLLIDEVALAFSKGALKGARGNSGVISSQIFKGFSVALSGKADLTCKSFADCLQKGTEIAYGAVTKPKEGTILTVIRVMAETATSLAKSRRKTEFDVFFKKVLDAGEEILAKTPEMLPVLAKAGVVDAGGRGLLTIFDGMYRTLVGEELVLLSGEVVKSSFSSDQPIVKDQDEILENDYEHITFQYCTEFFITHLKKEVTSAKIDKYRDKLTTIGDCVLVIGDTDLVKTHVHTNYPNMALEAALELGELDGVKIENMLEQYRKLHPSDEVQEENLKEFAMISICSGDGMASIFKDLLVDIVVEGGQTMNPSVDDILLAVNKTGAKNVFVLPNNSNIILAANQAKELAKANVYVVPTTNMPEGVSAALAFDPEATPEENLENMSEAFKSVTCLEITHAVRSTRMNGFSVKEGDIIGISGKKIIAKNQDIAEATISAVKKIAEGKDMLTLYFGEDVTEDDAAKLAERIEEAFKDLEVAYYYGGQPHYYYIISAE